MTTATPVYSGTQTLTVTALHSLASDTTMLAGWASDAIDNTASGQDAISGWIGGKIVTAGTLTANRQVEIWIAPSYDGGSNFAGGVSGTAGTVTLATGNKWNMKLAHVIALTDTTARTYIWAINLSDLFGGDLPSKFVVFIAQGSGAALSASTNELKWTPTKFESA